jgi:hypothetical protein
MPRVINLRNSGRKPNEVGPNEVYIGRATRNGWRKSKWANPKRLPRDATPEQRDEAIEEYREHSLPGLRADLHELRDKDLLCWCAPEACHGDLLLKLANADEAMMRAALDDANRGR